MNSFRAGGLATILFFGLALLMSGCAGTPPADGNSQANQNCEAPMKTGSRLSRRVCRENTEGASDD